MELQSIGKILNSLNNIQKANGLDQSKNANFDQMFSNVLEIGKNNQPNAEANTNKVSTVSSTGEGLPNFDNLVSDYVNSVNNAQLYSHDMAKKFVNGEDVELHEVMIAGEKAKTSLDLLIEIRNKTIDMYRELTRLQG